MTTLAYIEILVRVLWIAGAVCFVLGLVRMNSPATARGGNLLSAGGMAVAIGATAFLILARQRLGDGFQATGWIIIVIGVAIGGGAGLRRRRSRQVTARPWAGAALSGARGG